MKPLFVLIVVFALSTFGIRLVSGEYHLRQAGCIAMSGMLIFTAIGHFVFTKGMAMMIPSLVPFKTLFVYATGVLEIGFAVGLLIPPAQLITGWLLILFFIVILPVNINATIHRVDYQKSTNTGDGLSYLLLRIPLQLVFILWVFYSAIGVIC